jgi:hypothetical protein
VKRKPAAKRKDGTELQKIKGKEYEVRYEEKTGADGVPEDHFSYHGTSGKIMSLPKNLKCRNVMSAADRKRLGI